MPQLSKKIIKEKNKTLPTKHSLGTFKNRSKKKDNINVDMAVENNLKIISRVTKNENGILNFATVNSCESVFDLPLTDLSRELSQKINEPLLKESYLEFVKYKSNSQSSSLDHYGDTSFASKISSTIQLSLYDESDSQTAKTISRKIIDKKAMGIKNCDNNNWDNLTSSTGKSNSVFSLSQDVINSSKMKKLYLEFVKTKNCNKAQNKNIKSTESKTGKKTSSRELTLKEIFLSIHKSRDVGLYVFCDNCDKARYLPHIKDPLDLPRKWYCPLNPDSNHNRCEDPEETIGEEEQDYLIDNLYNSGSIVWARVDGFPWWPAMVDDDPDTKDYFHLDGSMIPTHYHVTFFDKCQVSRAWLRPARLKPFREVSNVVYKKYKARIEAAVQQANDALDLSLFKRLQKYSFIGRFKKSIVENDF